MRAGFRHGTPNSHPRTTVTTAGSGLSRFLFFPFLLAVVTSCAKMTNIVIKNFKMFLTSGSHITDSQILLFNKITTVLPLDHDV